MLPKVKSVRSKLLRVTPPVEKSNSVYVPAVKPPALKIFSVSPPVPLGPVSVPPVRRIRSLVVPSSIFPEVGGVEVEVSSTQMSALTDAYWSLSAYPYECAEQRSSRMLATAAIFDVLEAFATPGRPGKAEIEAQRDLDI